MAMDRINGSPLLRQSVLDSNRQSDRVGKDGQPADVLADLAPAASKPVSGDTAEISATAHRLMELRQAVDRGRVALSGLPDIREDKVAAARERLKSDYYQSRAVRDQVAEGVASVLQGLEEL